MSKNRIDRPFKIAKKEEWKNAEDFKYLPMDCIYFIFDFLWYPFRLSKIQIEELKKKIGENFDSEEEVIKECYTLYFKLVPDTQKRLVNSIYSSLNEFFPEKDYNEAVEFEEFLYGTLSLVSRGVYKKVRDCYKCEECFITNLQIKENIKKDKKKSLGEDFEKEAIRIVEYFIGDCGFEKKKKRLCRKCLIECGCKDCKNLFYREDDTHCWNCFINVCDECQIQCIMCTDEIYNGCISCFTECDTCSEFGCGDHFVKCDTGKCNINTCEDCIEDDKQCECKKKKLNKKLNN